MNRGILEYSDTFSQLLKIEIEKVLGVEIEKVGEQLKSADSYAFPYSDSSGSRYVGKIFRFINWPEKGHTKEVFRLLDSCGVAHEKVIHISNEHEVFKYGWLVSEYIPGGNAKELLENNEIQSNEYYLEL